MWQQRLNLWLNLRRLQSWIIQSFLFSLSQEGKREGVNCCKENSHDLQNHKQAQLVLEAVLPEAQGKETTPPKPAAPCINPTEKLSLGSKACGADASEANPVSAPSK